MSSGDNRKALVTVSVSYALMTVEQAVKLGEILATALPIKSEWVNVDGRGSRTVWKFDADHNNPDYHMASVRILNEAQVATIHMDSD